MQNALTSDTLFVMPPELSKGDRSELHTWLSLHAEELDTDEALASEVVPRLGAAGLFRVGVPTRLGGVGGTIVDAIEAVADIAEYSLTAALVYWSQRAFIECLIQTENSDLQARELPQLLSGTTAGAVALSNAIKFMSGIEELQVKAAPHADGLQSWGLSGTLPLVSNVPENGFVVAVAVDHGPDTQPAIFAIAHDAVGVTRGDNLDLIALRASNTASVALNRSVVHERSRLASNAEAFISRVRPNFLALQCGMSIGLARRSLRSLESMPQQSLVVMREEVAIVESRLSDLCRQLFGGVMNGQFLEHPARLFELRIALAEVVDDANRLEVRMCGGRGYVRGGAGVARRSREAAFVPIVTPSIIQLKACLLSGAFGPSCLDACAIACAPSGCASNVCAVLPSSLTDGAAVQLRLTALARGGGCGCKIAPGVLANLLKRSAPPAEFADLLVGIETSDDAAVYRLDDDRAIVATTDFFTPIVDDPFDFGRIAATNALSDIYAMGGKPLFALALVGMPVGTLPAEAIASVLKGGESVCAAAEIPVAGGHSIDSAEPFYGLAVIGSVHPEEIARNDSARPGDVLVLGKPLGIGILSAALQQGQPGHASYEEMIRITTQLNRTGTAIARVPGVHAMTDVTGFGLLGHTLEMCRGAGVGARIRYGDLPWIAGVQEFAEAGIVSGASARNWQSYGSNITLGDGLPTVAQALLTDPQTSGGLLVACDAASADRVIALLRADGFDRAAVVGEIVEGPARVVVA
jgi:selenide, water dikinase